MSEPMDRLGATADALGFELAGEPLARLRKTRDLWASYARVMNLVGPGVLDEQIVEGLHLVGALRRLEGIRPLPASWLDLGSGGGFPGLVVASCMPNMGGVLLEPRAKRCEFLELATTRLGTGWSVVRARVEGVRCLPESPRVRKGAFGGVSARAVWDPASWLALGQRWVAPGGVVSVHLHAGDPDPSPLAPVAVCASTAWDVRLYGVGPE